MGVLPLVCFRPRTGGSNTIDWGSHLSTASQIGNPTGNLVGTGFGP
jgi:hypothetical protein